MSKYNLIDEQLSYSVVGAFFEVYSQLGYGFSDSVYAAALEHELKSRGHTVSREVSFQIVYENIVAGIQRVDMIVDERLIVESKGGLELPNAIIRQLRSGLRASNLGAGVLLYYGPRPRFKRCFNRRRDKQSFEPPDEPDPQTF